MVTDNTPKWSFKNKNKQGQQKGLEGMAKRLGCCTGRVENDQPLKHQVSLPHPPALHTHSTDLETEERKTDLSIVAQCYAGKGQGER